MERPLDSNTSSELRLKRYSRLTGDPICKVPLEEIGAASIKEEEVIGLLFEALDEDDHTSAFTRHCKELGDILGHTPRHTRLSLLAVKGILEGQNWEDIGGRDPRVENEPEIEDERAESRGLSGKF